MQGLRRGKLAAIATRARAFILLTRCWIRGPGIQSGRVPVATNLPHEPARSSDAESEAKSSTMRGNAASRFRAACEICKLELLRKCGCDGLRGTLGWKSLAGGPAPQIPTRTLAASLRVPPTVDQLHSCEQARMGNWDRGAERDRTIERCGKKSATSIFGGGHPPDSLAGRRLDPMRCELSTEAQNPRDRTDHRSPGRASRAIAKLSFHQ